MTDRHAHWENVYRNKPETELSWHQHEPTVSLELICAYAPNARRIVDVGGGASLLAARLAASPERDVTVIDIAAAAITQAKQRLGDTASRIRWLVGDVTRMQPLENIDLWHDRAVFHFLTEPADRAAYVQLATRSIVAGGKAIIATFALEGPPRCSDLPVVRYDAATLAAAFAPSFRLIASRGETHVTPWGKPQAFIYVVLERA